MCLATSPTCAALIHSISRSHLVSTTRKEKITYNLNRFILCCQAEIFLDSYGLKSLSPFFLTLNLICPLIIQAEMCMLFYTCVHIVFVSVTKGIFFFYCYSITVVCLFSPSLHPTPGEPTSLPHLHPPPWFCPCVLYSTSCNPLYPGF